jgi:hypothetical protein
LVKQNVSVIEKAVSQIMKAAVGEKCWSCGCLHSSLKAMQEAFPVDNRPAELEAVLKTARERLTEVKHACVGCNVCYSASAINALKVIEKKLVTRLDHAAYLGRELARAEWALKAGDPYVQDAAPE